MAARRKTTRTTMDLTSERIAAWHLEAEPLAAAALALASVVDASAGADPTPALAAAVRELRSILADLSVIYERSIEREDDLFTRLSAEMGDAEEPRA